MVARGLVQPSHSSWEAPVLFGQKNDGSLCKCIDYRGPNKVTLKDTSHLPRIDGCNRLLEYSLQLTCNSATINSTLLMKIFQMHAFKTHQGPYEFKIVSFGLISDPTYFQRAMNKLFQGMPRVSVVSIYLDDILVFSNSYLSICSMFWQVFGILRNAKFYAVLQVFFLQKLC